MYIGILNWMAYWLKLTYYIFDTKKKIYINKVFSTQFRAALELVAPAYS